MAASLAQNPLFLVGFMATGKSTVGRLVAERLGRVFVDLDEEIARAAGKDIPAIFRTEGEASFRAREARALAEVATREGIVVACGGGTPCFGDNLTRMSGEGLVVALRASLDEILRRAGDSAGTSRPLLAGNSSDPGGPRTSAERLYAEREAVYRRADVIVDTDGRTAADVAAECIARTQRRLGQVAVKLGERGYPIHVAPLADAGGLAAELLEAGVVALVTDENVARAGHAASVRRVLESGGGAKRVVEIVVPPGEGHKTLATAERIATECVKAGLDRRSAIVAVGGGVVGDLAGFVASILFRGVRCAQVPTTLLAMVDSAIGGKTGVDLPAGKNLLGAFWQPRFVLSDVATLGTLPPREVGAGFGEILKYGLLADPTLFAAVEARGRDVDLAEVVLDCARIKAGVVSRDEHETTGERATLNLGHTLGHAIEAAAGYAGSGALLHGEAVALGLVAAARVSARLGVGPSDLEGRVVASVRRVGLDAHLEPWLRDDVFAYLTVDKKRADGKIKYVALESVGKTKLVELSPAELAAALR